MAGVVAGPSHDRHMMVGVRHANSDSDVLQMVSNIGECTVQRSKFWLDVENTVRQQPESNPWHDGVWLSLHVNDPKQLIMHFGHEEFLQGVAFMMHHAPDEGLKRVVLDPHRDARRVQYTGMSTPLYVTYVGFENDAGEDSFVSAAVPWLLSSTVYNCSLVTVYAFVSTRMHRLCSKCGLPAFNKCIRCRSAYYCNAQCQRAHWRAHRSVCRSVDCNN